MSQLIMKFGSIPGNIVLQKAILKIEGSNHVIVYEVKIRTCSFA